MQSPAEPPAAGWAGQAQRLQAEVRSRAGSPEGRLVEAALSDLGAGKGARAAETSRRALAIAPESGLAWRLLAMSLEGLGDLAGALEAYERAYGLTPDCGDLIVDLARMASALGLHPVAAAFYRHALQGDPDSTHLVAQLAQALRAAHDYEAAEAALRDALLRHPQDGALWNAAGEVRLQRGDADEALALFEEALRRAPSATEPLYNRACARFDRGDLDGAAADCEAAAAQADAQHAPAIRFLRSLIHLGRGDLAAGWASYEARFDPGFARSARFAVKGARWTPQTALEAKRLLIVGEQGVGDEVMFAGLIGDAVAAVGEKGAVALAVTPRLVGLFQRSFPTVEVVPHATATVAGKAERSVPAPAPGYDVWAPMGSLAQRFRPDLASFGRDGGYLVADPDRTKALRARLAEQGEGPRIGLIWKSQSTGGERRRGFAPFEAWAPVLRTPGLRFVNLQYGDCAEELAWARERGVDIWTAPDLDLREDLDGAAALGAAVDLVIGFSNASTNLAAACGVPTWFVMPPAVWTQLGTAAIPWYPQARVFAAESYSDWTPVLQTVADALGEFA